MVQKKVTHEVDNFLAHSWQAYPIILIYGINQGLVSERAALFAKKTGIDLCDPFAAVYFEAVEIDNDPVRLIDEVNTLPIADEKRLIWIRNAGLQQKGLSKAIKWLLQDIPKHIFILIEAGELKKNTALRSLIELASSGIALPCYDDEQSTRDLLINTILEEFSLCITKDARKILHDKLGTDRLSIRNELEKLCIYMQGEKCINSDDVVQIVSDFGTSLQDKIFDAIITGNLLAFDIAFTRQTSNSHPSFIISIIQRQFQQLQEIYFSVKNEGTSLQSVLSRFHPSIFYLRKKIIEQALLHWSTERIACAMDKLQISILESRKKPELAFAIIRHNLMILTCGIDLLRCK